MIDAWLEKNGRTRAWLADVLGITTASLSRIVNNKQTPSLRVAVKIEQTTGIPAACFTRSAQGQAA